MKLLKSRVTVKNIVLNEENKSANFQLEDTLQGKTDWVCLSHQSVRLHPPLTKLKKIEKVEEKTTRNLVIKPKIDIQREQQQPSKLQSNFSSMLQAPGFSRGIFSFQIKGRWGRT